MEDQSIEIRKSQQIESNEDRLSFCDSGRNFVRKHTSPAFSIEPFQSERQMRKSIKEVNAIY